MQIYIVQPGDTLYRIAQQYGTSVSALQSVNQLTNPDRLIIGQAIVIPGPVTSPLQYTVQSGDTLYQLAQLFNTTVNAIAQRNNIMNPGMVLAGSTIFIPGWSQIQYSVRTGDTLAVISARYNIPVGTIAKVNKIINPSLIFSGQSLMIPQPAPAKPSIEVLAYFQAYSVTGIEQTLPQIGHNLTYGAIFDFPVSSTADIAVPDYLSRIVSDLKSYNIRPLAVITNLGTNGFDSDLARTIISDASVKAKTISNLLGILKQYNLSGVNIDFENMYPQDRQLFNGFISDIVTALKPQGFLVSIAAAPKSADFPNSAWVGTFDYATLGRLVDFIYLMTYDWGWIGGPPAAIAPITQVREVLAYASSLIPANKILLGIPFYAYDWPVPFVSGQLATPVDLVSVYNLASQYHASINYDTVSDSPWFDYTDGQGGRREVWFEDARSVSAKYTATKDFKLRGVGYWTLWNNPYGFPQNWAILNDQFAVINTLS